MLKQVKNESFFLERSVGTSVRLFFFQRLARQKDIDADEEHRRKLQRKRQIRSKREKMLLNAITGKAEADLKQRSATTNGDLA